MRMEEVIALGMRHSAGDLLLDLDDIPWVPQARGVWFRPLRISLGPGTWTSLLRVAGPGTIGRHRHVAPVEAWVISGQWRYLEHDWTARAGSYVYEPAGDVHTLVTLGDEEMITLVSVHGPIEYLGSGGEVGYVETAETKLRRYAEFCESRDIQVAPIIG